MPGPSVLWRMRRSWSGFRKGTAIGSSNVPLKLIELIIPLLVGLSAAAPHPAEGAPYRPRAWGDQGDGTFRNPVLPGDFSDPDVIRVGSDYYLITSTFQYSPGMAIMHSRDMVNWQYLGHCIPDVSKIGPELNWDRMNRDNRGVYAGSIRYHEGKFWVFYTTMDEGMFMTTAKNAAGPWEPSHCITNTKGYDDNCPFWDDNGEAWMIASKPGKNWWTYLYKMSPDGRTIDMASETVIDDHHGSEGNKIMKIKGMYYIFHNQIDGGGNRTGVFMRAKSMQGPWEKKLFLWGSGPQNDREPNQGGLVDTPDGQWWFMTHHGRGGFFEGRICSLLPVKWVEAWPMVDEKGPGVLVPQAAKPVQHFPAQIPQTSDDFTTPQLPPQWEWNYAPRKDKWSLSARPGWLRLEAWPALKSGEFLKAGNTLSQRVLGTGGGKVVVKADISGMADGQFGGVAAYWGKAGLLGVIQKDGKRTIELRNDHEISEGPAINQAEVWLKLIVDDQGGCTFAYSLDNKIFTPIGGRFSFGWANYRGTRLGLFTWNDKGEKGQLDFDWLRYDVGG